MLKKTIAFTINSKDCGSNHIWEYYKHDGGTKRRCKICGQIDHNFFSFA